jgi:hypothetical protein
MKESIQKLYNISPQYVIGFHGCDKKTADSVISNQKELKSSCNEYDWLGHGLYFWENDYYRAIEYANILKKNPKRCKEKINNPAVIGAIINLGHCLDLTKRDSILLLTKTHEIYKLLADKSGFELPKNEKGFKDDLDLIKRKLDCAVIEYFLSIDNNSKKYDSIRGVFIEGNPIYKDSGFNEKTHIQICIRNPNCIKGYFYPQKIDNMYNII